MSKAPKHTKTYDYAYTITCESPYDTMFSSGVKVETHSRVLSPDVPMKKWQLFTEARKECVPGSNVIFYQSFRDKRK